MAGPDLVLSNVSSVVPFTLALYAEQSFAADSLAELAAAALRAAAYQVEPDDGIPTEVQRVLDKLLAIADELEGVKYGTYRCNLEDKPQ
jgi:hypothetical protein